MEYYYYYYTIKNKRTYWKWNEKSITVGISNISWLKLLMELVGVLFQFNSMFIVRRHFFQIEGQSSLLVISSNSIFSLISDYLDSTVVKL